MQCIKMDPDGSKELKQFLSFDLLTRPWKTKKDLTSFLVTIFLRTKTKWRLERISNWDKVFKNRPSKIYGGQLLKYLKEYALGRPYHFRFLKGGLPQILLGPFLNILSELSTRQTNKGTFSCFSHWTTARWTQSLKKTLITKVCMIYK